MTPRGQFFFHRALSRIGLLVMTGALTLVGVRLGWGWLADKRLADARRALTQQKLPLTLTNAPPVEEPQNAAALLVAAVNRFQPMTWRGGFGGGGFGGGGGGGFGGGMFSPALNEFTWLDERERQNLQQAVADNAETFSRLEQALSRQAISWDLPLDEPPAGTIGFAEKLRGLEEMILARAVVARIEGRDRDAGQSLVQLMGIDRIVTACPAAEAQQHGAMLRSRLALFMERFADKMLIETPAKPNPRGAAEEDVRRVIAALLQDTPFQDQLILACERQMLCDDNNVRWRLPDFGQAGRSRDESEELDSWWLRPLQVDEKRRLLEQGMEWLQVVAAPRFDAIHALPPIKKPDPSNLMLLVTASSAQSDGRWNALAQQKFRALADGRAAAVLLAARWAQQDQGDWPTTAEGFVPRYLPAKALDPFAKEVRPLRYRLDAKGPTVWSVGLNGVDENALISPMMRGRGFDQPDLVYGAAWQAMRASMGPGPGGFGPGPGGGPGGGFGGRGRFWGRGETR